MSDQPIRDSSVVTCPHLFTIKLTGNSLLTIANGAVVTTTSLETAVFSCTNQSKCTKIGSSQSSSLLHVGGVAVVLGTGLKTNIGTTTVLTTPEILDTE